MISVKLQNAQIAALSADKNFQSLKQLPQNNQRIFEAEITRQMEEARDRTEAAEKSEKSRIQNQKKKEEEKSFQQKQTETQPAETDEKVKPKNRNIIEKEANGTIKHLDIKI
ncbi:hypothetical protein B1H10_02590 [candidate division KSB1 bacterium 4484_188]|nr:MAG: hypothetical protein B1H10_02590 [candidate division KSB1 bacterium 4484_188]